MYSFDTSAEQRLPGVAGGLPLASAVQLVAAALPLRRGPIVVVGSRPNASYASLFALTFSHSIRDRLSWYCLKPWYYVNEDNETKVKRQINKNHGSHALSVFLKTRSDLGRWRQRL